MNKDTTDQQSLTDYVGEVPNETESATGEEDNHPSPENPDVFLSWLEDETEPSPEIAVDQLPELITIVQNGGYQAWPAGNAINLILNSATPPISCPELIRVLGNKHVQTDTVIKHLLQIYPRDTPILESAIDEDIFEESEITHTERMEGYRALSRLPPDDHVYQQLRDTAEMFNEVVSLDKKYPVGGFFQTYAMRCLNTFFRHPETAPRNLAHRAILDHPFSSLRIITANPKEAVENGLVTDLTKVLENKDAPRSFRHGQIISTLCESYIKSSSLNTQDQLSDLIITTLSTGIYPTKWQITIQQLIRALERDNSPTNGKVLAAIFNSIRNESLKEDIIREITEKLHSEDPTLWTPSVKILAESQIENISKYIDTLVTAARSSDHPARDDICEAIATVATKEPEVVLPAIEPLVTDIEHITTVQDLTSVGRILHSLSIYPPPPQLRTLYESTDESIEKKAKEIVRRLRRDFQTKTPALKPGELTDVQALSEDYSLVKRTGAVTWESPSLDSNELSVIDTIAKVSLATGKDQEDRDESIRSILSNYLNIPEHEFSDTSNSVQFVVPSYDTKWVEFIVLGAVFAQIVNPEIRVALHTPGTGGWGTKKDINEILKQYGITPTGTQTEVIPILDLVPTARVTNGDVTVETTGSTVSDDPPFLTLTRSSTSLEDAPADLILYNYLPGIDGLNAAQIQQWRNNALVSNSQEGSDGADADIGGVAYSASLSNLVQTDDIEPRPLEPNHDDTPIHIEMYSIFTSQYAADRRQYVGPPTDLPLPNVITEFTSQSAAIKNQEHSTAEERCQATTEVTKGPSQVDLRAVSTDSGIGDLLSKIDTYCREISDHDTASALRGFKYTIGSLPVPVNLHDTWIQNQLDEGNTWVPRRIHRRRDGIQSLVDEASFDAELLDEALISINTLLDRLAETNPITDELLGVLDDAAADGKQVGILCSKKTYKDMLDLYLRDQASDWILGDDLQLLDEDTVRSLSPGDIDWLITFDPLPPQTAIYYHHPAVKKTIVLGHNDGTLQSRVHGVDSKRRPYLPDVDTELPELDITTYGRTVEMSETNTTLTDDLYRTYLSVAAQSQEDSRQSGSSQDSSRYHVEFEEIEATRMWDTNLVIVRSDDHLVSAGEYTLRPISQVVSDDEVVLIEPDTRGDLWEVFLRDGWEDSDEVDAEAAFIDAVELWYNAVSNGLTAHSNTEDMGDGIWGFAREIESDVSVSTEAIVDWARGVYNADSPSELVFRSELRIGPQYSDGVEAVAKTYGNERMAENWEQVFTRIKSIRVAHRQRGSVFWEWLAERACDGDLFNEPGVKRVTVTQCIKHE